MDLPTFEDLMLPCLKLSVEGIKVRDSVYRLIKILNLSDEQVEYKTPKNRTSVFYGRVNWAITYLKMAGLVEKPSRGFYQITDLGKAILEKKEERIDVKYLEKNTSFERVKTKKEASNPVNTDSVDSLTPLEQIEEAYESINNTVKAELLEKILSNSPTFFEYLVVELLKTMGYGQAGEIAEAIGKTNDGGIDGVIYEDKLGLDIVYIQAKRYDPKNVIGRPALQSFIGSLSGFSASKGVFITTSSFSSNVEEYLKSVQQRVITIDGNKLVELMLQYGVGVRREAYYEILKIDEEYFND
jgi:restriction system protein